MPSQRKRKPTKAESGAIDALLCVSIVADKRHGELDALFFLDELKSALCSSEYKKFLGEMQGIRSKEHRGDVNFKKGVAFMAVLPELCLKFSAFFHPVVWKRHKAQVSLAAISESVVHQPATVILKTDILPLIVRFIPYKSLGYFISTCKYVRLNVTTEQIELCKARAKSLIGGVFPVPDQRFGVMFDIYDLLEEKIRVGYYHKNSQLIVCRFNNKVYIGEESRPMSYYFSLAYNLKEHAKSYFKGEEKRVSVKVSFDHRSGNAEDDCVNLNIYFRRCNDRNTDSHHVLMHPLF
jgi:hypothetical protein